MPSRQLGLGIALLVLLSGCIGAPGAGTDPATDTTSSTTTTTTISPTPSTTGLTPTTSTTTSPPETTSPPDTTSPPTTPVPADAITPYSNLTDAQQSVFDSLVANGSVEGAPPEFHGLSEEIEYVRYDGTVYHVFVAGQTGLIGKNYVSLEETLERSELETDQPVTNYSELDPAARTIVRDAIAGNDSAEPYSSGELADVFDGGYVVYRNGTYYRLQVVHADVIIYELGLEPVSEEGT